ncbi:MAG: hypothetical protein N2C12_18000, partial [Planctomycetales bacterium]
ILDSVLPHEITHTIFATYFRQPLPRWADEGACTTVEHKSEKARHQVMLIRFLQTKRGIAFSRMLLMKEYPKDIMPLYAQGYSLARYLIQQGGRRKFVNFIGNGLRDKNWIRALDQSYGYDDLALLQNNWLEWVKKGSPPLNPKDFLLNPATVASQKRSRPNPNLVHRVADSTADVRGPEQQLVSPHDGWYATGQRPIGEEPFAPGNTGTRHQAGSQQPAQRPKQRVLR